MDLRPSLPFRSPLARLNTNNQQQRRLDQDILFSPEGGRTTRAASLKLRMFFEDNGDNEPCSPIKINSSACFAAGESDGRARTQASENDIDDHENARERQPKKKRKKSNITAVSKKIKSKLKKPTLIGRWETWERFEFLRGLRRHGRGHWKKIGESIPTRSTIQVKTHAQVMLRKLEQGIDIFEELDDYTISQILPATNAGRKQKAEIRDGQENFENFPLPETFDDATQNARMFRPEESCSYDKLRRREQPYISHHRPRHSFPPSNEPEKGCLPSPFQPVTTTTVTTTMVGNHNHHHPFHHQGHHHYGTHHHNQHYHPYQITPSFDSIATTASASAVAAAAASSALFPTTQQQSFQYHTNASQASVIAADNRGSNHPRGFRLPSKGARHTNLSTSNILLSKSAKSIDVASDVAEQNSEIRRKRNINELVYAELEAVEALLSICSASENVSPYDKNRVMSI